MRQRRRSAACHTTVTRLSHLYGHAHGCNATCLLALFSDVSFLDRAGLVQLQSSADLIVWTALLNDRPADLSPPRFEPGGWMQWPDNEDYSLQFMRVLGSAQEGGSTVSECFLAASRIVPGDDESWYRAWTTVADSNRARGDVALGAGHLHSALSNWLRASNYYRTSEIFLKLDDSRRADALERMRACSSLVVSHQD